ncbi:MAG: acyl--CoA ligase, partial [Acidimicrobiaceae bacterium]|nr:acyl--CoA ligase [Acidimicrobiaceae bacterium]
MTRSEYTDLWSLCVARTEEHPDRVVLDFDGKLWTWAELMDAAKDLAGGLTAAGVGAGEVVCHMSPNHPEGVVTMLALLRLGAVECPVNAGLRGQQLAHVLDHSGARVLIVAGSLSDRVDEQLTSAPQVQTVVVRGGGQPPAGVSVLDYEELRGSGEKPPPFRPPGPGDPMNIIYTSGTTGPAKGAVLPQAFPIEQARIKIEQWGLTPDDVMFSALPLYHVNARFSTLGTALVVDGRAA